jgi:hypothetical protein
VPSNAQSLANLLGKILRINKDGTIPSDNPFFTSASGRNRAIWALGLRNPFTFAFDPAGGHMFINDVGQDTWEEINDGRAGGNYGWPTTEGRTTDPRFISPRYAYDHNEGCAITGGAFYSPLTPQFPAGYARDYFFAEFCGGWIRRLDVASNSVTTFATGIASPVDLKVSDNGALYYLARGSNAVYRVSYAAAPPAITTHPSSRTVSAGSPATFSVRASGTPPLRYQWRRNGVDIPGATASDYTLAAAQAGDNGARFRAIVVNSFGNALSNEAVLTVTGGGGGTGNGLAATYFDNSNLTGASVSRIDPRIDFVLGSASPAPGIGPETFSARWTGQVMPQFSETYTFYTVSNDGVRLWVNGVRIVNNWTNHGTTENRGTIALTGGQRYSITMEWYEDTGNATARLLWSSSSTAKAIVPSARLFRGTSAPPSAIRVNFQLNSAPVPAGYLKDGGHIYGDRGNGRTYGWNADNSAQMRDRNSGVSPDQRYDTLAYMQRPANPDAVWQISVPNGTYVVHAVAGDPSYYNITYRIAIEGVLVVNGTSNSATRWIGGTSTVTVTDGRLTLRSASGATANKICFVDITPQ